MVKIEFKTDDEMFINSPQFETVKILNRIISEISESKKASGIIYNSTHDVSIGSYEVDFED